MKTNLKLFLYALLFTPVLIACSSTRDLASTDLPMEYVEVCRAAKDCKKLSRLVMGTDHLAQRDWVRDGHPQPSDNEVFEVLDEAARLGINFFDSSPIYVGDAENKLGRWMKSRREKVLEDDFYVAKDLNPDRKLYALSKGGFPFDLYYAKKFETGTHSAELKTVLRKEGILAKDANPSPDGSLLLNNVPPGTYASRLYGSQAQIESRVAEELRHSRSNLNDEVTIYLMHRDDKDYLRFNEVSRAQSPVQTIMKALSSPQLTEGYWMVGWSNWLTLRVDESVKIARKNPSLVKPLLNSPYFSLFEMSSRSIHAGGVQVTHQEMMSPKFQEGIHIMPYSPLGGFSIFDKPSPQWENAERAAKIKHDQGDAYWQNVYPAIFTQENRMRWNRVIEFTDRFNKKFGTSYTHDQVINAYALAHRRTDFLAVGAITVEQLRRTVASLKLAKMLTPADLDYLHSGQTGD